MIRKRVLIRETGVYSAVVAVVEGMLMLRCRSPGAAQRQVGLASRDHQSRFFNTMERV